MPTDQSFIARKDLENRTYHDWIAAEGPEKLEKEVQLRALLSAHAQAVSYGVLRYHDQTAIAEAADKVFWALLKGEYKPAALFTTWAHQVLMHHFYDVRKYNRRRREVTMEGLDIPGDPSIGMSDVLMTVGKLLTPGEREIFNDIVIVGLNQQETANKLGIKQQALSARWGRITRKLKDGFTKRLQDRR